MQKACLCGTPQVGEDVNGAGVRVAHARAVHGHATGNILLVVPFHGINDVPLFRLGLPDHSYEVTSSLMENGTVWHRGRGSWLRGLGASTEDGIGNGRFPCTARKMLSFVQEL
jgi:hypothetical protein